MYEHPLTAQHIATIENVIGYEVNGPVGKTLACGDVGTSKFHVRFNTRHDSFVHTTNRDWRDDGLAGHCETSSSKVPTYETNGDQYLDNFVILLFFHPEYKNECRTQFLFAVGVYFLDSSE